MNNKFLKSILSDKDFFISFYEEKTQINILAGNYEEICFYDCRQKLNFDELIIDFENALIKCTDTKKQKLSNLNDILDEIFDIIIPESLKLIFISGNYEKLIIFPDKKLHLLPIHRIFLNPHKIKGVIYNPSASTYFYSCEKIKNYKLQKGLIILGDEDDILMRREAEEAKKNLPFETHLISKKENLNKIDLKYDFLYIISHGWVPKVENPIDFEINSGILFDSGLITSKDFFLNKIRINPGALVFLSACNVGRLISGETHEMHGIIRSLFYAGASNIISAKWPVRSYLMQPFFMSIINNVFIKNKPLNESFRLSIENIKLEENGLNEDIFIKENLTLYGSGIIK